jgi:secreted PhoX family phosphatase
MGERPTDRRTFVRAAAGAAGAAMLAPSLAGLVSRSRGVLDAAALEGGPGSAIRWAPQGRGGYGPLVSSGPELLLPEGFSSRVVSRNGQPMSDGTPTPGAFDGMACFPMPNGNLRLVRNHENRDVVANSRVKGDPAKAYDRRAGGGTTTIELRIGTDGTPEIVRDFVSLNGTIVNCAGGPTPWGSWLSCEESVAGPADGWEKKHGYIFEVPAALDHEVTPVPLTAMGRFVHEAVAVDAVTGIVYETEDRQTSGLYRFIPHRPGVLAEGGRLQMLAIRGEARYDTTSRQQVGVPLPVRWVDIEDPDPAGDAISDLAVFSEGTAKGGARFARLEGCWYADDSIYFHSTNGGDAQVGQVWRYIPRRRWWQGDRLVLVYESPSREVLDYPDNITVSPRGGIVICEDGAGEQYLRGLTPRGELFDLAKNVLNNTEFAGACFSPDGGILFVNIMGSTTDAGTAQGRTLAIRGPWARGAL